MKKFNHCSDSIECYEKGDEETYGDSEVDRVPLIILVGSCFVLVVVIGVLGLLYMRSHNNKSQALIPESKQIHNQ